MKLSWFVFGITAVLAIAGIWRFQQYPLPNPPAQNQRAQCAKFFAARPNLNRVTTFLKSQSIGYNQLSQLDVFMGNTATDFQRRHQKGIGSGVVFRIHDIKKPLCGRTDALFVLSFGKDSQLLQAENWGTECCCLDF